LEVISKLSQTNPPSQRTIAGQYNVSEATIRKVRAKREVIHIRCDLRSEETKKRKFRAAMSNPSDLLSQNVCHYLNQGHTLNGLLSS